MDKENQSILKAPKKLIFQLLINGDTVKQLLAEVAIYFINPDKKWTNNQEEERSYYLNCILIKKSI
jgi:hypothetical protein